MEGGANPPFGVVFKLTLNGNLTVLQASTVRTVPIASRARRWCKPTTGTCTGRHRTAGANNAGTFFEITPSGTLTTLYSFCSQANCTDGTNPCGFVQAPAAISTVQPSHRAAVGRFSKSPLRMFAYGTGPAHEWKLLWGNYRRWSYLHQYLRLQSGTQVPRGTHPGVSRAAGRLRMLLGRRGHGDICTV